MNYVNDGDSKSTEIMREQFIFYNINFVEIQLRNSNEFHQHDQLSCYKFFNRISAGGKKKTNKLSKYSENSFFNHF